ELRSTRLSDDELNALKSFLDIDVPVDAAAGALRAFASASGIDIGAAVEAFARRAVKLGEAGLEPGEIRYDAAFGRPLDYYTGLVFEMTAKGGRPLVGGGRYDRLLTLLGASDPIPGVGFSVWLDRVAQLRGRTA